MTGSPLCSIAIIKILSTHVAAGGGWLIVELYATIKMGGTCSCHSILCKELVIVRILKFAPLALTYAFYGQNVKAMNMNLLKA